MTALKILKPATFKMKKKYITWESYLRLSVIKYSKMFSRIYMTNLQIKIDACFMLVSCLAYSSTLKMEAICSSKTYVVLQMSTWRYIPEGRKLFYCNQVSLCYRHVCITVCEFVRLFVCLYIFTRRARLNGFS
jgi:hypothetical protein